MNSVFDAFIFSLFSFIQLSINKCATFKFLNGSSFNRKRCTFESLVCGVVVCKTVDCDGGRNDIKQCSSLRQVEPRTKTTTLGDTTLQITCRR
ncbi:hypothetical protein DPMN_117803 [Dreissena polymorpha]|uniref:Uncharacterized protein n=1 Tax=Dreissena polymorpha TaxID=45954 RepID=A0A9D4JLB3_DREPO|nr:hypothetical protein DPMN_117803 [Dreissena polymorpha]